MNARIGIRIDGATKEKLNELTLKKSSPKKIVKRSEIARDALELGLNLMLAQEKQLAA